MGKNNKIDLEELAALLGGELPILALKTIVDALRYIAAQGSEYSEDSSDPIDAVNLVLSELREIVPEIDGLADTVNNAWWDYEFANAATMDEAFGYSRPKHWRQEAERFRINNISAIRHEVERLNEQGLSIEDAFAAVGDKYSKSSGLIKKLYYDLLRRKREHSERFVPQ